LEAAGAMPVDTIIALFRATKRQVASSKVA
jgi:hypothetical protein